MKRYRFGLAFALWGMLLYGAIDAMRSATGPMLQAQIHITYTQLGTLFAANSIGYLVGSFPSGFVVHRVGLKQTLLVGSIVLGAVLVLISFPTAYLMLWMAFFSLGFVMGWLEIAINAVVPAVSQSPRAESTGFNLLHGFYGVGATMFPIIVTYLATKSGHWSTPFWGVGALTMLAALSIVRYQFPSLAEPNQKPSEATGAKRQQALAAPLFYALLLGIMLYVLAEVGTATWLPTYLVHAQGMSLTASSWYLTAFYLTFTIGRLTGPLWVHKVGSYASILWSSIFSLVLFALGLVLPHYPILFIVSGFGFAVTFPTIVHLASQAFPGETGRVIGMLLTFAGIGSIFVNWLVGFLATKVGINGAFWLIPSSLLLVSISTLAARWLDRTPLANAREASL
ncbi:MFS transporter [Alicyclobacillus fastidiosus]|uniref:MFS transporter n=1 Tax=Alicyclobacillus fastidiosus TaxID=392011 RepID=A0ABV5AIV3_9BACL|nr:MFS transporter [Alicyclobacillus fastidiosus]WEH11174.1 MFS transporter [Alicyclobacillus fastidiosus]